MFDVTIIGGGIMGITLVKILKELNPSFKVLILESRSELSTESSAAWNNAGTGHAGLCELNYTPYKDNVIDIEKALETTEAFEWSKQFWSFLVKKYGLDPTKFIRPVPHVSFVTGKDMAFLSDRYDEMKKHHFYEGMEYSNDFSQLNNWAPLLMENRKNVAAATFCDKGTDVNYEKITKLMANTFVDKPDNVLFSLNTKVIGIKRHQSNWMIECKRNGIDKHYVSKRVFVGAGGTALTLLEKSGIPEAKGYGGFPVSGKFLVCKNKDVIKRHHVKAYGNAKIGAKLGVGIDPGAMGGQTFRVDTPTADWQAFFHNPKGERG